MRPRRLAAARGLPVALCTIAALWSVYGQETPSRDGLVTLRYNRAEGTIVAADVTSTENGVVQGNVTQDTEAKLVVLERTRDVSADAATLDEFTLGAHIRVTVNGQPMVGTDSGLDIDLGEMDPRWRCETRRETPRGEVTEAVDLPTDEPLIQVIRPLERMGSILPPDPVSVGDSWTLEHKPQLDFGQVSATTAWRLDRVENLDGRRVAILTSDSEATLADLAVPEKRFTREIGGQQVDVRVEEYIVRLEAHYQTTMRLDIEAGAPLDVAGTSTAELDVTQKVTVGGQVVAEHGAPMHLTREGTSTITFRPPTDEELVLALPVALAASVERKDLTLLRTVVAPEFQLVGEGGVDALEAMLEPVFAKNERLDSTLANVSAKTDGVTGSVAFMLTVKGGLNAESMAPVYERPVTLRARKGGDTWLIVGMDQQ